MATIPDLPATISYEDIYKNIMVACDGLRIGAPERNNTMIAFTQMIHKGFVGKEEMLQVANAIPGAFQIAAECLAISMSELRDQLEGLSINAKTFLPKFAKLLCQKFSVK